jgi:hypothetical protein
LPRHTLWLIGTAGNGLCAWRCCDASGDDPRKVVGIFYTVSSERIESIQASDWIFSADISNLALHILAAPTRRPWPQAVGSLHEILGDGPHRHALPD